MSNSTAPAPPRPSGPSNATTSTVTATSQQNQAVRQPVANQHGSPTPEAAAQPGLPASSGQTQTTALPLHSSTSQGSAAQLPLPPSLASSPAPSPTQLQTSIVSSIHPSAAATSAAPQAPSLTPLQSSSTTAPASATAPLPNPLSNTQPQLAVPPTPSAPSTTSPAVPPNFIPQRPASQSSSSSSIQRPAPPSRPLASWKSFSLRWPYLIVLIVLSLLLLAAIEALRQISNRGNGLWHLEDPDTSTFPTGLIVAYTYLPTILGMIYSILWSYIDMDIKRLEPYVQMRSPSSPSSILFLDYVYESAFVTPFRALKRRHWFVAVSSLTYLLISLVLPASQGALFGVDRVSYSTDIDNVIIGHDGLIMGPLVSGDYVDQARAIAVPHGSKLPPWTTANYSVMAFWPEQASTSANATWTTDSRVYYAEPKCRRYNIDDKTMLYGGVLILELEATQELIPAIQILVLWNISLPDSSCKLSMSTTMTILNTAPDTNYVFPIHTKGLTFVGFSKALASTVTELRVQVPTNGSQAYDILMKNANTTDPQSFLWYDAPISCPDMNYLAGLIELDLSRLQRNGSRWDMSTYDTSMILYDCGSDYYEAIGTVTMQVDNATVVSVREVRDERLLSEEQFGRTQFGAYLEKGSVTFIGGLDVVNDSRPTLRDIEHAANIADVVLGNLTSQPSDPQVYRSLMDSTSVGNAFEAVYKLIFALTLRGMINSPFQARMAPWRTDGTINTDTFAVVVVSEFAILSETLLALGTIVLCLILVGYHRRRNILASDPDSISAQCSIIVDIIKDAGILASSTRHLDLLNTKDLCKEVSSSHVEYDEGHGTLSIVTTNQQLVAMNTLPNAVMRQESLTSDPLPTVMTKRGIAVSTLLLSAIFTILLALVMWVRRRGGFSYLADSSTIQSQFFWSFMPTIFATCIETFWMSVHRDLSVLEGWVAVRKGYNRAEECLSLRYASRPPSLVLFLSLMRKHFLVAFVSLLCISTSILNITMAGLFLSSYKNFDSRLSTLPHYTASTLPGVWQDQYDINQAFSILRSSYSDSGMLLPWTTEDRAFLPIDFEGSQARAFQAGGQRITSTTAAVESPLDCVSVLYDFTNNENGPGIFTKSDGELTIRYTPSTSYSDTNITCSVPFNWSLFTIGMFFKSMQPVNLTDDSLTLGPSCPILVVSLNMTSTGNTQTYGSTIYACTPQISVSEFDIQSDQGGNIFSAEPRNRQLEGSNLLQNQTKFLAWYEQKFLDATIYSFKQSENTTYDWAGLLMTRLRDNSDVTSIPDLADGIWRSTFATWFSYYSDRFLTVRADNDRSLESTMETITYREARMVPVIPTFAVSIVLLLVYVLSFLFIVCKRRHRYAGPRMPKTIGSILPWVIHSRMLDDFAGLHSMSSRQRDAALRQMDRRYGFGRFRGKHGRVTLGIEHEELLMARGAFGDF